MMNDVAETEPGGLEKRIMEKDGNELELENLVFGDRKGFQENLKQSDTGIAASRADTTRLIQQQDKEKLDEMRIEDLEDADVCDKGLLLPSLIAEIKLSFSFSILEYL